MTIQQWLFSFKGRIGRRDFWIWMVTWVVAMLLLFFVAYNAWLSTQTAALRWSACCGQRRRWW
jgi:uncharacterized membrane protein YhaH (DUF805 family)